RLKNQCMQTITSSGLSQSSQHFKCIKLSVLLVALEICWCKSLLKAASRVVFAVYMFISANEPPPLQVTARSPKAS
ncbi:hypothetical protein M9458_054218, partial [Cirrhinus mrigala]